jgi:regulator of cell morphogenesis and NO signaling
MEFTKEKSVGSYVAENYRAASVFQKYGIDFCCRGGISINEVAINKNLDPDALLGELKEVMTKTDDNSTDFRKWDLDKLADYIVETHHKYVSSTSPILQQYLDKICEVHGERHPELFSIRSLFNTAVNNLQSHMQKEEVMLFPYIRKIAAAKNAENQQFEQGHWTVQNPVRVMMMEHDAEGERFREISRLSHSYTTPEDACRTYQVAFAQLKEFESDLHRHIHLENNILFPGAIQLEEELVNA